MATRVFEKAQRRKEARKNGTVRAVLKGFSMSARKMRVLVKDLNGKSAEDALLFLAAQPKKGAEPLMCVLRSSVANAANRGMDVDRLFIRKILVDKGPILRRFMPRAQGRATRIRKQTTHVQMELSA